MEYVFRIVYCLFKIEFLQGFKDPILDKNQQIRYAGSSILQKIESYLSFYSLIFPMAKVA